MTRSEFILWRWRHLVEQVLPSGCSAGDLVSTRFTLYRRQVVAAGVPPLVDDLGIQTRPTKQDLLPVTGAVDLPCLFVGTGKKTDRWHVHPEGQDQEEQAILTTSYLDVREGDNARVTLDGKAYLVQASTRLGPLVQCMLTTAKAQL